MRNHDGVARCSPSAVAVFTAGLVSDAVGNAVSSALESATENSVKRGAVAYHW
jgi:hypothetical protein